MIKIKKSRKKGLVPELKLIVVSPSGDDSTKVYFEKDNSRDTLKNAEFEDILRLMSVWDLVGGILSSELDERVRAKEKSTTEKIWMFYPEPSF